MINEVKMKLEEIVTLLNDPDATVLENELILKLEKIVASMKQPESVDTLELIKQKLDLIEDYVSNAEVDPDIDVEYYKTEDADEPYIVVTYIVGEYNKPKRKIRLNRHILSQSPQEIANQVTSSIEEFKSEIDAVQMG